MTTRVELAALAAAPVGLVGSRLLGPEAVSVWFAAACVLVVPGWGVIRLARLERQLGLSGALPVAIALGLAAWAIPLAFGFALGTSLGPVMVAGLALGWGCALLALRRPPMLDPVPPAELAAGTAAALAFALLAWRLSNGVVGDALFHVGRMRKLGQVDALSLSSISSFQHGAPHAGYAFPLLHAAWEAIARAAAVDAAVAFVYLVPFCALAAIVAAYALVTALSGWRLAGYLAAVLVGWDLCTLINGLVMQINQPPVFAFAVLTPAAVLLFLVALRGVLLSAYASAAVVAVIALVHPTYAIPCLAIMAGVLALSWRAHLAVARAAVVAVVVSMLASAAVAGWIWWVAIRGGERRQIITHSDEFVHHGARALLMYPWAPVYGRGYVLVGIVSLALLVRYRPLLPAAGAVLGPLGLLLIPGLNTLVMAGTGMGQFHRFWQVLPWPVAVAAAACVGARLLGRFTPLVAVPLALVMLHLRADHAFWREPASWVVVAGIAAVVVSLIVPPRSRVERGSAWASALLVAAVLVGPVVYGGDTVLDQARAGPHRAARADLVVELSPAVVRWFRSHDNPIPVVLGEDHRLFELIGGAPVYAQALPEARTRAEPKIDTQGRRRDERRFFDPSTTPAERAEILQRWAVDYVLLDLVDQARAAGPILADPALEPVYRGRRFIILRARR